MREYCGKRSELAVIDDACTIPKWEIEKVLTVSLVDKKDRRGSLYGSL